MTETKYGKYIVSVLQVPESKQKIAEEYSKYAKRILWLDDQVVEGAFHMNTAWYLKAASTLEDTPHTHDSDEIIGFFGNNPEDPYDLGGEIEIWLEDEQHVEGRAHGTHSSQQVRARRLPNAALREDAALVRGRLRCHGSVSEFGDGVFDL